MCSHPAGNDEDQLHTDAGHRWHPRQDTGGPIVKKFGTVLPIENGEIYSLLTDILDSCDSRFLYDAIRVACEQGLKNEPKNN
jgi:hypothetical protein